MPEVALTTPKTRLILLLLVSLGFVTIGVAALNAGDLGVSLFSTLFFGLAAGIFAIQLHLGACYLRLTPQGFYVRSISFLSPLVPWHQFSDFRVEWIPSAGQKMIVYNSTDPTDQRLRKPNRALAGATDALPDTYDMKPQHLAALINQWRAQHHDRA